MIKQGKIILKKIIALINFLSYSKGNRFIFVYHDISEISEIHHSKHYSTTPDAFIKQINFINKNFVVVQLNQLMDESLSIEFNYASIVFDDGFYSVYSKAFPILKSKNIPFTIFVNKMAIELNRLWLTDIIFKKQPFCNNIIQKFNLHNLSTDEIIQALINEPLFQNFIPSYVYEVENINNIYLSAEQILYLKSNNVLIEAIQ